MIKHFDQIQRMKVKLAIAKNTDKNLKVFGASVHEYLVNKPITLESVTEFEDKYSIELPDCYKAFILNFGNGGISSQGSAAGPYYGIYPFNENVDELIYEDTEKYLRNECLLSPKMSDEDWNNIIESINENEDMSDDDYEKELGRIWAGVLPIGSQGCSYIHGIALNGAYKGRVVNIDIDRQKPRFAYESNFLDWYERWLDEVISQDLIADTPSWFGRCKGGTEKQLFIDLINSANLEDKNDNLIGLLNKVDISHAMLEKLQMLLGDGFEPRDLLVQILYKSDYQRAKPYLLELAKADLGKVFQFIFWYAKDESNDWISLVEQNVARIDDEETFRYFKYLLEAADIDMTTIIEPLTRSPNETVEAQALDTIENLNHIPRKKWYEIWK